jgi:hypothetical protein
MTLALNKLCGLMINDRGREFDNERSDWAVSDVIMYNRELSISEILYVEAYLSQVHTSRPTVSPTNRPTFEGETNSPTLWPTFFPTGRPTGLRLYD